MKIEDENERSKLMKAKMQEEGGAEIHHGGCPGSIAMNLSQDGQPSANTSGCPGATDGYSINYYFVVITTYMQIHG